MAGIFNTLRPASAREFGRPIQNLDVDANISSTITELFGTSLTEDDQRSIGASPELARTALLMVGEGCGTFECTEFEKKYESVLRHCRNVAAPSQVFTPEVDVIAAITALLPAALRNFEKRLRNSQFTMFSYHVSPQNGCQR